MGIRDYFRSRGVRVVTCPETHEGAAVNLDAFFAAKSGNLRLSSCSRWPERAGCDQACLAQIASAPEGCLLRSLVAKWYEGKGCFVCQRPIELRTIPALLAPDGTTFEWKDAKPEDLPRLFSTHHPLCWYCNNVAELARLRPGLAFEGRRPAEKSEPLRPTDALY